MTKASSPIRLAASLIDAATQAGAEQHRTTPMQIEYWAELGRLVARQLDADTLLSLRLGQCTVVAEPVIAAPVDPAQIMASVMMDRQTGALTQTLLSQGPAYQASKSHPGMLEQVHADGRVVLGTYKGGRFVPVEEAIDKGVKLRVFATPKSSKKKAPGVHVGAEHFAHHAARQPKPAIVMVTPKTSKAVKSSVAAKKAGKAKAKGSKTSGAGGKQA